MADGLDYDDDDEVPTEEMVERMEERLDLVQNQQKRLFLIIFQVQLCMLGIIYILLLSANFSKNSFRNTTPDRVAIENINTINENR